MFQFASTYPLSVSRSICSRVVRCQLARNDNNDNIITTKFPQLSTCHEPTTTTTTPQSTTPCRHCAKSSASGKCQSSHRLRQHSTSAAVNPRVTSQQREFSSRVIQDRCTKTGLTSVFESPLLCPASASARTMLQFLSPPTSDILLADGGTKHFYHTKSSRRSPLLNSNQHCASFGNGNDLIIFPAAASSLFSHYKSIFYRDNNRSLSRNIHSLSSSSSTPLETSVKIADKDSLVLHFGEESRTLPFLWLRDHCRCPLCYNHETGQKQSADGPVEQELGVADVTLEDGDKTLVLHWKDTHLTRYSVEWLMTNSYSTQPDSLVHRTLWDGDAIRAHKLPSVPFESHMETDDGLSQTLRNLLQFGFSFVHEAPVSLEGTRLAVERLCRIQESIFGGIYEFTANGARSDTAYGTSFLAAHTDNTYLETPPGIQVFHCLEHDGEGGETLLVDGFYAIDQLRQTQPQAVRCLSSYSVPHEYKELPLDNNVSPGYHLYTASPVIKLHPTTGEIQRIRFNPYDRAPLTTVPPEHMAEFYQSYELLSKAIADPKSRFWVKLKPGHIVFIDNWRVMHGRAAFDGKRMMCGCYLPRDEWQSRARMLGLAPPVSSVHGE